MEPCKTVITALRHNGRFIDEISNGQDAAILVDQTCFYAEQGGQSYDNGCMKKVGDEVSSNFLLPCCLK